eukprot:7382999-Prymnesium_polylepis.1
MELNGDTEKIVTRFMRRPPSAAVTEQWQLPGVQCRLGTCNTAARPEGLHVLLLVDAGREGSTISRLHERVGDAAAALC